MSEHISSVKLYITIWVALMVGTILTVVAAKIDLGVFNPIVALAIASTKAVLVVLFFMHVKYAHERLTKLVIVTAVFFFLILLALTMADYSTRLWT
jgi:cytochrome c oxidase subunit IV